MVNILGDLNSKNNTKSFLPTKQKSQALIALQCCKIPSPPRAAAKTYRIPYFLQVEYPQMDTFPSLSPSNPGKKTLKKKSFFFPMFSSKVTSSARGNAKADRRAMMVCFEKKGVAGGLKGALLAANRSNVFFGNWTKPQEFPQKRKTQNHGFPKKDL